MLSFRTILASIKRADELFALFNDGDKIVIGISGGKDSVVLFHALARYQEYSKKNITLYPVMLNLGFNAFNPTPIIEDFKKLGYDLIVRDASNVYPILEIQQEKQNLKKLPCSICSIMKKAAINEAAKELGANKVSFAHHIDDALETLLMNMISGGRLATFQPKMHLDRANITFIRPLILVDEETIIKAVKELKIPVLASSCPNDKHTRREDMKQMLTKLYGSYDSAKVNFQRLLLNDEQFDMWYDQLETEIAPGFFLKKVNNASDFNDAFKVRIEVFVLEQGISFNDEYDAFEKDYKSYVLLNNSLPVGTIRYKLDKKTRTVTLGRIAVLQQYRNKGLGKKMIAHLENLLSYSYRPLTFTLLGQTYLKEYYEKLGYTTDGETHLDANLPHYRFTKKVS